MIWICNNYPTCDAYVGCHKDSTTPLGRMANSELRHWKKAAHGKFDPIWKTRRMNRSQAYSWLAKVLQIEPAKCHIGMFDIETCKRVIEAVNSADRAF